MTKEEYLQAVKADPYLVKRKESNEWEVRLFLKEVDFHCPLCGKILQSKQQKKLSEKLFQIAHIYPNSPTKEQYETLLGVKRLGNDSESFENKIALCKDCHGTQDHHTTLDDYLKLLDIKVDLLKRTNMLDIENSMSIEREMSLVIEKLRDITEDELVELNFSPVKIADKFEQNEILLKNKVSNYVSIYFPLIREIFKNLDGANSFRFSVLSCQIRACFEKLDTVDSDKFTIFNHLVSWIQRKTNSNSLEACEAIVSFFIQNCEVFNEIAK